MATRREQQAAGTRALLVATARRRFGADGYTATSIEAILGEAGVARGGLYHHFSGKDDLLLAVAGAVADELADRVAGAAGGRDPWAGVAAGCATLLDACLEPEVRRVLLLDAPAVLGERAPSMAPAVAVLGEVVARAVDAGGNPCRVPVPTLAAMLGGAVRQAALHLAGDGDPATARIAAGDAVSFLLDALRSHLARC